jgi:hypothetical protein
MEGENRKAIRRRLAQHAMLRTIAGRQINGCIVRDISDLGARLSVLGAAALPDNFDLILSSNGGVSRRCRVVWRGEKDVGVEFIARGGDTKSRVAVGVASNGD